MNTPEEMDAAAREAQWAACIALRAVCDKDGRINPGALARASYHAGEAHAYFRARDVVEAKKP